MGEEVGCLRGARPRSRVREVVAAADEAGLRSARVVRAEGRVDVRCALGGLPFGRVRRGLRGLVQLGREAVSIVP